MGRKEESNTSLPTYFGNSSHSLLLFDHAVNICAILHNVLNRLSKMAYTARVPLLINCPHLLPTGLLLTSTFYCGESYYENHFFVADQCRQVLAVHCSVASTAGIIAKQRPRNARRPTTSHLKYILSKDQKYFKTNQSV